MSDTRTSAPEEPRGPIAWMAQNSIAANLLMVMLLAGGLWSAVRIQKEVFPEFELDVVEVSVGYPGAAPAEVEQGILRPVEEAVRAVEGIREITSEAREGRGSVSIELVTGTDRMKAFQEVDQAVSRIRTFPDDIDQPDVRLRSQQTEVMSVGLYGPVDIWTLRQLAEQLRDQLLADPQITQVELGRVPDYVTHVEIPRNRLREYGLTLPDVARLIESSSEDVAAGAVQTSGGEILLRVKARKQWAEQFGNGSRSSPTTTGSRVHARETSQRSATASPRKDPRTSLFNRHAVDPAQRSTALATQSPLEIAEAMDRRSWPRVRDARFRPASQWRIGGSNGRGLSASRLVARCSRTALLAVVHCPAASSRSSSRSGSRSGS